MSFLGLQGGQAFFSAVKEGDLVIFATNDEQDRTLWVQAMYRATGQSYKPLPPAQNQQHNCRGGNIQKDAPASLLSRLHPLQSVISHLHLQYILCLYTVLKSLLYFS